MTTAGQSAPETSLVVGLTITAEMALANVETKIENVIDLGGQRHEVIRVYAKAYFGRGQSNPVIRQSHTLSAFPAHLWRRLKC